MEFGVEMEVALNLMDRSCEIYKDFLAAETLEAGRKLVAATRGMDKETLAQVIQVVRKKIPYECPNVTVWWYSILLEITKSAEIFIEFVGYLRRHQSSFSVNTQYFLYYQLKSQRFRFPAFAGEDVQTELWEFFDSVINNFSLKLQDKLSPIAREKRNEDVAVVITEQFISIQHGPTKTALDRCKTLMSRLGKKVLLINTSEVLSSVGKIPFYNMVQGSYDDNKCSEEVQYWKGSVIPYFQCPQNMPDIEILEMLIDSIRKMAPALVVSIGGSSVLSNLVSKMVPVLTVGLSPSDLEFTKTQYQTLSRKTTDKEKIMLETLGYNENHIIESVFTSGLKDQTEKITREQLNIPDDVFLMVVVGGRLDVEVTDDFLAMLDSIIKDGMHLVFIGTFNNYETYISRFPQLKDRTSYLGFCNDILSRMEVCDLYINPVRKGGGTSCVEALYKGVPVVTTAYGDVSVNVGEDFCVKDYKEMQDQIINYYEDKAYHQRMSEKAIQRAEILLDTDKEFVRIVNVFMQRTIENER